MPPKRLASEHHIVRHCGHQKVEWVDGRVAGVFPQAFELRSEDEGYLSASWLEYFSGERAQQLRNTIAVMRASGRKIGANSALVELSSGRVRPVSS